MMITDHSNINNQLKDPAQQNNVKLPDSLSEDKQNKVNELIRKRI